MDSLTITVKSHYAMFTEGSVIMIHDDRKAIVLKDKVDNSYNETITVKPLSNRNMVRLFQCIYYRIKIKLNGYK